MEIKIHLSADDNIIEALVDGVMAWAKATEYQYKTETLRDRRERDRAGHLAEWSIDWASAAPEAEAQQAALTKTQKQETKEGVKPSSPPQAKVQKEPKAEVSREKVREEVKPTPIAPEPAPQAEVEKAPAPEPAKQEKVEVAQEEVKSTPTSQPKVQEEANPAPLKLEAENAQAPSQSEIEAVKQEEKTPEPAPEKTEQKPINNVVQMPQRSNKPVPTLDQLKVINSDLAKAKLSKVAKEILARYGVQGINNIPLDKRAEYLQLAQQALLEADVPMEKSKEQEEENTVSFEDLPDIRAKVRVYLKATEGGDAKVKEWLKAHGAERVSKLNPADMPAFLAFLAEGAKQKKEVAQNA